MYDGVTLAPGLPLSGLFGDLCRHPDLDDIVIEGLIFIITIARLRWIELAFLYSRGRSTVIQYSLEC